MKKIAILTIILSFFGLPLFAQNDITDIKTTTETEASVKAYYDTAFLDPIEGIYKTTTGAYYRIAIRKYDDKYLAIILDAENKKNWKVGTVKAYIEKSAIDAIFSIRWLMGDKTPKETTATPLLSETCSLENLSHRLKRYNINAGQNVPHSGGAAPIIILTFIKTFFHYFL